ncbi:DUF3592 domain-containing protein [Krasilnikovia sp. MM14-A1004]|uniref:DUF3592 domain-containing protein n=1 Tax=Krasilnikovia sp. MM14-A1004 TaxID=3373541 RepID=UPI00399CE00C
MIDEVGLPDSMGWVPAVLYLVMIGIPALAGCVMITAGVRGILRNRRIADIGYDADAVVVDNQQRSAGDGRISFRPVVTYRTRSGQEIKAVIDDAVSNRSYLTDTRLQVRYDPDQPDQPVTAGRGPRTSITTIVFGFVFLGFAALVYQMLSWSPFAR